MSTSTSGENNDLQRLALEQDALLVERRRRLAVRDRIDDSDRPTILSKRLPASGNRARGASALIQAALRLEFTLSGFSKLADPRYAANFNAFVGSTPGAPSIVGTITVTK